MMKMRLFALMLLFTVIMTACNDEDKNPEQAKEEQSIFLDYKITAEEQDDLVTCKFQFRKEDAEGESILLNDSSMVLLDGEQLHADSSRFQGYYYEKIFPMEDFRGRHTIVYTASTGKQYREEIEFNPFTIEPALPYTIPRKDLLVQLKNFPERKTRIRLVMTDTAFATSWINKTLEVENGEILITSQMLERLKTGPIGLELHREERKRFMDPTSAGGRFIINYSLKRELELIPAQNGAN